MTDAISAPSRTIPTLPGGTLGTMRAFRDDPLALFARARALGGVVRLSMPFAQAYAITDAAAAVQVLASSGEFTWKGTRGALILRRSVGEAVHSAEGASWAARRALAAPALAPEAMGTLKAAVDRHVDATLDRWFAAGAPVDVIDGVNRAALRIVGDGLLGVDVSEEVDAFVAGLDEMSQSFPPLLALPLPQVERWPLPGPRRFKRAIAALDALTDRVIARRRAAGGSPDDLLGRWLAAAARGELDEADVRSEVLTTLLAGQETIANAVGWTLALLAHHPAQARAEDVDAIVSEGLRLYPPTWILARRARVPLDLGGQTIPAGSSLFLPTYTLQRDPVGWPDPERFDPARWAGGPTGAWLPFGDGPRRCLGQHLARFELRAFVGGALRRGPITPDGPMPAPVASINLRPKGGLRLRFG